MTSNHETLTQIVASALADGLTYRAFHERAVDPQSDYRPSLDTLFKISKGRDIQLSPKLVLAVAAGLNISPERAQRAAAAQYAGYTPEAVSGGTAIKEPGSAHADLAPERDLIERWDSEVRNERNHPGR